MFKHLGKSKRMLIKYIGAAGADVKYTPLDCMISHKGLVYTEK